MTVRRPDPASPLGRGLGRGRRLVGRGLVRVYDVASRPSSTRAEEERAYRAEVEETRHRLVLDRLAEVSRGLAEVATAVEVLQGRLAEVEAGGERHGARLSEITSATEQSARHLEDLIAATARENTEVHRALIDSVALLGRAVSLSAADDEAGR